MSGDGNEIEHEAVTGKSGYAAWGKDLKQDVDNEAGHISGARADLSNQQQLVNGIHGRPDPLSA